jgi:hypothetical protein
MNTGTYKEEYGDGSKGWHVERGAPPKPVGGPNFRIKSNIKTCRRLLYKFKKLQILKKKLC